MPVTCLLRLRTCAITASVLAALSVAGLAQAQAGNYPITNEQRQTADQVAAAGVPLSALAANAPESYTVKRGDTLWDISSLFLTSPWRWPELWGMNKTQIANPHLIYPGQMLRLVRTADGRARLEVVDAGALPGSAGDTVKLAPRVRGLEGNGEAIAAIPSKEIEPFLSQPAVVAAGEMDKYPRIVATQEGRVFLGRGDTAYARGLASDAPESFNVFRPAKPLFDPDDTNRKNPIAYEAFYLGGARLAKGGEVATLSIVTSVQEIGVGDRLLPVAARSIPSYVPRSPQMAVDGKIVSIYSGLEQTGTQSVVTLNRGSRHGLEVGHVLSLLETGATVRDRTVAGKEFVKLPDERIGEMFVFRVFDDISYALVMRVTKPVRVGDRFTQPEDSPAVAAPPVAAPAVMKPERRWYNPFTWF